MCQHKQKISTADGEIVCANCGQVLKERSESLLPEPFDYEDESYNRIHHGSPFYAQNAQTVFRLSTPLDLRKYDANGNKINNELFDTIARLSYFDNQLKRNRSSIVKAYHLFKKIQDELNLSDSVIDRAFQLFFKAQKQGLLQGRDLEAVVTAIAYLACRESNITRTIHEFVRVLGLPMKSVRRCYMKIRSNLGIEVQMQEPEQFVYPIAGKLNLKEKVIRTALEIIEKTKDGMKGKKPRLFAAAAIYLAIRQHQVNVIQDEVAEAAYTSSITIRIYSMKIQELLRTLTLSPPTPPPTPPSISPPAPQSEP